jgi:hypothetical protein
MCILPSVLAGDITVLVVLHVGLAACGSKWSKVYECVVKRAARRANVKDIFFIIGNPCMILKISTLHDMVG